MSLPPEQSARVDGMTITYREAGSGFPLVLVHGMGGGSAAWEAQYESLSDRYRVIGWDGPGFGGSDEFDDERPLVDDYARVLAGFFDALDIERAHLAGHSFGGILICAHARRHPDRVAGLALLQAVVGHMALDWTPERRAETEQNRHGEIAAVTRDEFARIRAKSAMADGTPDDMIERAARISYSTRPRGYLQQWAAMFQANIFDELADGIDAPSLFVSGGQDATSTGAARDRIKAAMPGIRTAEIAHSGHVIYMEAADELNILLGEFFDSQGDTP
jgi:pimeloyl-ACP methyl ester carboxylesterase